MAEKDGVRINNECKELIKRKLYRMFLNLLVENALNKHLNSEINENPRYFIGIEIENATSINIKYMPSSITNLHLLCKIGILVVMKLDSRNLEKINRYLSFIHERKKLNPFSNVILIEKKKFDKILEQMLLL